MAREGVMAAVARLLRDVRAEDAPVAEALRDLVLAVAETPRGLVEVLRHDLRPVVEHSSRAVHITNLAFLAESSFEGRVEEMVLEYTANPDGAFVRQVKETPLSPATSSVSKPFVVGRVLCSPFVRGDCVLTYLESSLDVLVRSENASAAATDGDERAGGAGPD